jgi:hypothetical protein
MTIQIPDDLASGLERVATLQHKSIDQLAVDSLRQLLEQERSPEVILRAPFCALFSVCLIRVQQPWTIWKQRSFQRPASA